MNPSAGLCQRHADLLASGRYLTAAAAERAAEAAAAKARRNRGNGSHGLLGLDP